MAVCPTHRGGMHDSPGRVGGSVHLVIDDGAEVLARVDRGGVVEAVHAGHAVALGADGAGRVRAGDPDSPFLPRSTLKPLQAVAMLRAGLELEGPLLALACASHEGEPGHVEGVHTILEKAGLDPGGPADPGDAAERARRRLRLATRRSRTRADRPHVLGQARCDAGHLRRGRLGPRDLPRPGPRPAGPGAGDDRRADRRRAAPRCRRRVRRTRVLGHGHRHGPRLRPDRDRGRVAPPSTGSRRPCASTPGTSAAPARWSPGSGSPCPA